MWGVVGGKWRGGGGSFRSPELRPLFKKGDLVHVFEGTGSGQVKMRSVGWFGRVIGRDAGGPVYGEKQNSVRKGAPSLIAGEYQALQKNFGVGVGTEERTHFRTLSKRTRERIEESVDRRNGYVVKEVQKEIRK